MAKEKETEIDVTDEFEIEVVDDTPEDDQQYVSKDDDEEAEEYSKRVQKRINKLKREYHDERREKETQARIAQEAINHTRRLQKELESLKGYVGESAKSLTEQIAERGKAYVTMAERELQDAHESGDSKAIAEAQRKLTQATMYSSQPQAVAQSIMQRWQAAQAKQQEEAGEEEAYQSPVPEPDPKAVEWSKKNPWFGKNPVMTSMAHGLHAKLVMEDKVDPTSDEYYQIIDQEMRKHFPDEFDDDDDDDDGNSVQVTKTRGKAPPTVVSPVKRGGGGKPRRVVLTESQVHIANALGVPLEEYARQMLKEETS